MTETVQYAGISTAGLCVSRGHSASFVTNFVHAMNSL